MNDAKRSRKKAKYNNKDDKERGHIIQYAVHYNGAEISYNVHWTSELLRGNATAPLPPLVVSDVEEGKRYEGASCNATEAMCVVRTRDQRNMQSSRAAAGARID